MLLYDLTSISSSALCCSCCLSGHCSQCTQGIVAYMQRTVPACQGHCVCTDARCVHCSSYVGIQTSISTKYTDKCMEANISPWLRTEVQYSTQTRRTSLYIRTNARMNAT
jgi:hypothetical protein